MGSIIKRLQRDLFYSYKKVEMLRRVRQQLGPMAFTLNPDKGDIKYASGGKGVREYEMVKAVKKVIWDQL